jgi:hypothetical protein
MAYPRPLEAAPRAFYGLTSSSATYLSSHLGLFILANKPFNIFFQSGKVMYKYGIDVLVRDAGDLQTLSSTSGRPSGWALL